MRVGEFIAGCIGLVICGVLVLYGLSLMANAEERAEETTMDEEEAFNRGLESVILGTISGVLGIVLLVSGVLDRPRWRGAMMPPPPYHPQYPQPPRYGPPPPPVQVRRAMVVKCPACGYPNLEGARFCNECGKHLRDATR